MTKRRINNWQNNAWHNTFYIRNYCETYSSAQIISNNSDELSISPNPASAYISLKTGNGNAVYAKIFDTQGHLVRSLALRRIEPINLAGIPSGNYILHIIGTDGKAASKPFVIAK